MATKTQKGVEVTVRKFTGAPEEDERVLDGRAAFSRRFSLGRGPVLEPRPPREGEIEIKVSDDELKQQIVDRQIAATRVHKVVTGFKTDLSGFFGKVPAVLPTTLHGQLLNSDSSPADTVSVEALKPAYAANEGVNAADVPWPKPRTLTDFRGAFKLTLPSVQLPKGGLTLRVSGSNTSTDLKIRAVDLEDGEIGVVALDTRLTPAERSVVAQLKDIVPTTAEEVEARPEEFTAPAPAIRFGEGDCARAFHSNASVIDRYRYSLLVRLVDPQVSPRHLVLRAGRDQKFTPITIDPGLTGEEIEKIGALGTFHYTERVPVDRPVDVTAFRLMLEGDVTAVPKAGTLGLGYVISMRQTWEPAGLSLGDLVYSLALAPGEQQRVAVHERAETLTVRDAESLSMDEAQQFSEAADSSTLAMFNSSYNEASSGGSRMHTEASSGSFGGAGGLGFIGTGFLGAIGLAGGYASNQASGSTSSWQKGSRDYMSTASQQFHSTLNRRAAASRRSSRTGVRLASSTESEEITTKVIANHNHCHALTIQWWEVLRHYAVTSVVDDAQLVCFVPLELIQFRQQNESVEVPGTRAALLARYEMILQYLDVLSRALVRPEHRRGLTSLRSFAADPTTTVQTATQAVADVIDVSVTGGFLPFDELYVTLITRTGGRVGPLKLTGAIPPIAPEAFSTSAELLQHVQDRRVNGNVTLSAQIALPTHIARSDVVRFELSRRTLSFGYKLKLDFSALTGFDPFSLIRAIHSLQLSFGPADLDRLVGGPFVWDVKATIGAAATFVNAFAGRAAAQQMSATLQFPANRVGRVLSFDDVLLIEGVYQHIAQNAVYYSRVVWQSLTPEERVLLLEPFTIGVPEGGVADPSQEIPLLNCVANEVLGFYGNAMVMPFAIPPALAERTGITSRDVQEALLRFHREGFAAPRSSITLPTRGMLGEAVLGGCNSCEKIDLTRFWNWQDSQGDAVDQIKAGDFATTPGLVGTAGAAGPDKLATGGAATSLVTIGTGQNAPAPSEDLIAKLIGAKPEQPLADITGRGDLATQVTAARTAAETARKETIDTGKAIAEKIIDKLPEVAKADAAARTEAEEKKKKTQGEADTARKAKIDALGANPDFFIDRVMAVADNKKADEAKTLLDAHFGGTVPPLAELIPIYGKFSVGTNDPKEKAKSALLQALGLMPK